MTKKHAGDPTPKSRTIKNLNPKTSKMTELEAIMSNSIVPDGIDGTTIDLDMDGIMATAEAARAPPVSPVSPLRFISRYCY